MNALKHGGDAAPENEAAVMRALGEDPERYAALKRELATAYGPGDALWDRQLDDLAKLYWRRNRIERMETGLLRQDLEAVEERWRGLVRALADVTIDPSQCDVVALDLPQPTHPCVRLRILISLWGVILEQVRRRVFSYDQQRRTEAYYREVVGWRPRQIGYLLGLFQNWAFLKRTQDPAKLNQYVKDNFGSEAEVEARYQELVRLVEEQIAEEEAAFAEEKKAQERKYAIEHDECLAPEGKTWEMLLRQEAALDRWIDRKVSILLTMRKEHASRSRGGSRTAPTRPSASPPEETPELSPTGGAYLSTPFVGMYAPFETRARRHAKKRNVCGTPCFHDLSGWPIRADAFCRHICALRNPRSQTCQKAARLRHPVFSRPFGMLRLLQAPGG